MTLIRTVARSLLVVTTLAYMLALGQLAQVRLATHQAGVAHDRHQLAVICAEHGLQIPMPGDPGHRPSHDCSDCIACSVKVFATGPVGAPRAEQPERHPQAVVHAAYDSPAHGSRAPPGISARGPPDLI